MPFRGFRRRFDDDRFRVQPVTSEGLNVFLTPALVSSCKARCAGESSILRLTGITQGQTGDLYAAGRVLRQAYRPQQSAR